MKQHLLSFMMRALIVGAFGFATSSTFAANTYRGDYWHTNYKAEVLNPCPCIVTKPLHSGLYVGAGLGYDSYRIRQNVGIDDIALDGDADTLSLNPPIAAAGEDGSIFAGYGQYYDWFYIAGELFVKANTANTSFTILPDSILYNARINVRTNYGAAILPGIKLTDSSLFYGRLGAMRTSIKTQEFGNSVGTPSASFNETRTPWVNGVSLGVGIETAVYKNLSMRLEYNHTFYSSFISLISSKFSPSNNEVNVGLLYHFDLIC